VGYLHVAAVLDIKRDFLFRDFGRGVQPGGVRGRNPVQEVKNKGAYPEHDADDKNLDGCISLIFLKFFSNSATVKESNALPEASVCPFWDDL